MKKEKRAAIKAYFAPFPRWTVWTTGGVVVSMAWLGPFFAYGLGWVALAAVGWVLKDWFNRPGDEEMDLWTQEDLERVIPHALDRSHLDPSQKIREPVTITSLRLKNFGKAFFGVRRGKDLILRFTPVNVTIINFTEHQLVIYRCALDLTTGVPLNEGVD